jgi:hypothetical protein
VTASDLVGASSSIAAPSHPSKMEEIPSSVLMVILIVDGRSEGSNQCWWRVMAIVKVVVASAMTMAEGGDDGKVEQRQMWQKTAALMANASIDGRGVVGCHQHRPTATAIEGNGIVINNREGGQDGGESSEIFGYCVRRVW